MTTTESATRLPWADRPDHHCFGCAPRNSRGLALEFRLADEELTTEFVLDKHYESYPGVTHGGILGLICDETLGNLIVLRDGTAAVTTSMRIRYVGIAHVGSRYRCTARITATGPQLISGTAEVVDETGALITTATASYRRQENPA